MTTLRLYTALAVAALAAAPLTAQTTIASSRIRNAAADTASVKAPLSEDSLIALKKLQKAKQLYRPIELQHFRPADQRGLNVFETPKEDNIPFEGMKLVWGGAFTQQFQGIGHENKATAKVTAGVDANQLVQIGHGFNNAVANLNLGVQLAPGIRVAMTTYASARHHQETWVKDGYFLMDASPIDNEYLNKLMEVVTLRVGHFEINYGDQHFRRTDNGNSVHNPFVGNLLMDAFTTEIGAEVYLRGNGLIAMGGMTAGEVKGQITAADKRAPSYLGKLGFDKQFDPSLRIRMTGSLYTTTKSASNTLYSGDRAGSRYYDVLENTASTETAQAWSGNVRPGMSDQTTAMVFNPFVKYNGLELFGTLEKATGRAGTETSDRTWKQTSAEAVYRFLDREQVYVGARYNTASGTFVGIANEVSVDRTQLAMGWYVTPALLTKIEWVNQKYNDFPTSDIRAGGKFKGFIIEGAVAF